MRTPCGRPHHRFSFTADSSDDEDETFPMTPTSAEAAAAL